MYWQHLRCLATTTTSQDNEARILDILFYKYDTFLEISALKFGIESLKNKENDKMQNILNKTPIRQENIKNFTFE